MQRAIATKSLNVDSKHVYIYLLALLYSALYVAQSTFFISFFFFFFFSCVYVNGDHAHTNEQAHRNQILFEHAITITITARTRICPRARIRMITAVRASTHSHTHI
jgi:hypothetical protein